MFVLTDTLARMSIPSLSAVQAAAAAASKQPGDASLPPLEKGSYLVLQLNWKVFNNSAFPQCFSVSKKETDTK